jgi:hypothetical protein
MGRIECATSSYNEDSPIPFFEIRKQAMDPKDTIPTVGLEINPAAIDSQEQLREFLKQLSPEQLYELANFAGYLAEAEGETVTQELLAIPGLRDRLKQHQADPKL